MTIGFDLINGLSLGFEYVPDHKAILIDLLLIRILFQWEDEEDE